jgi:hypothetical protein
VRIIAPWADRVQWADNAQLERIHVDAFTSFDRYLPGWESAQLPADDPTAYHHLLAGAWARGGDLLIVEHDMVVHADVLPQFEDCPEIWCGFEYLVDTCPVVALGCTRFRAELLTAEPDLFESVGLISDDGFPHAKHFLRLDARMDAELRRRGHAAHKHLPRVQHLHVY